MIKAMTPRQSEDIQVVQADDGTTVITGDITFANLATAVQELVKTLRADENNKVRAARIVDAIDRQELYREAGVETMKAFFPMLLEQTAAIGWKSATSIKRYLGWYRLYLRTLQLEPNAAIGAVSHLHILYKLAHIDRKTGELAEPEGTSKLGPVPFEDIVRLVTTLVGGFSDKVLVKVLGKGTMAELRKDAGLPEEMAPGAVVIRTGLNAEQTANVLVELGMETQGSTYEELMGEAVNLPARGWTLAQTEAIISKVQGDAETEEDDAEVKVQKVWVGYEVFDGGVFIERLEFRKGEVKLDELPVEKQYALAHFEMLRGGDAAEIAGQGGEQE